MSAQAHSLFAAGIAPPRPTRAPRVEVPFATPASMAEHRELRALFTCASRSRLKSLSSTGHTAVTALSRVLDELQLEPNEVSVSAFKDTPNDVEIRDESKPDQPRHLLALVFQGLNIAEARAALAELRTPTNPKGGRR